MSEWQGLQTWVRGFPSKTNVLFQKKEIVASQEANNRSVYNLFQHECQNFINLPTPISPRTKLFREQFQQGERERRSKLWGGGVTWQVALFILTFPTPCPCHSVPTKVISSAEI